MHTAAKQPKWNADQFALKTVRKRSRARNNPTPRALRTDKGGDLGVDDAAGQEVKVVLHRVHDHRVSRVVAALRRQDDIRKFRAVGVSLPCHA